MKPVAIVPDANSEDHKDNQTRITRGVLSLEARLALHRPCSALDDNPIPSNSATSNRLHFDATDQVTLARCAIGSGDDATRIDGQNQIPLTTTDIAQ